MAGVILLHGNQAGHALALHVLAADGVAGALGGHHDHVDVLSGFYELKVDVKAVSEHQHVALFHVRSYLFVIDVGGDLIRHEHHHNVGSLGRLRHLHDLQAGRLRLRPACAVLTQANDNINTALVQVLCVRVALAAVTHNGNGLSVQKAQVAVRVIILFDHFTFLPLYIIYREARLGAAPDDTTLTRAGARRRVPGP